MDKNELPYFVGFNDGVHACNMAILALIEGSAKVNDVNKLKMLIAHTGKILADIMESTSERVEQLLEKEK